MEINVGNLRTSLAYASSKDRIIIVADTDLQEILALLKLKLEVASFYPDTTDESRYVAQQTCFKIKLAKVDL